VRLKLDENLGREAGEIFREAGHDTETVIGQGMAGFSDQRVIAACQSEQRCLVTLDLDFANPLNFPPNIYHGIAVFRLPPRPVHDDLHVLCRTLIVALGEKDIRKNLWIVQKNRIREYQTD
jgi:predicted nuclease of predicted toxin-antitoxin system